MKQLEDEKNVLENRMQKLEMEYQALPEDTDLRAAWKMLVQEQYRHETKKKECGEVEENWKKLSEQIQEKEKRKRWKLRSSCICNAVMQYSVMQRKQQWIMKRI